MNNYKTIRQIADELGIDKQKVYRYIRRNHINEAHQTASSDTVAKWYDEAAQSQIKQHFSKFVTSDEVHHEVHQSTSNDVLISMLQKELDIKNKQIEELTSALSETSKALHAAQALHAGTLQTNLIANESEDKPQEKSRGLFSWLFKRK